MKLDVSAGPATDGAVVARLDETLPPGEIERIVAERQELRSAHAPAAALEENRRRLTTAQSELSLLPIARYLPQSNAA